MIASLTLLFGSALAVWGALKYRILRLPIDAPPDDLARVGLIKGHGGTWSGAVDGVFLLVEPNPGGGWVWLTPIAPPVSAWPLEGGPLDPRPEPPLSGLRVDGPLHVETLAALSPALRMELPTWNGVLRAGYLGVVDPNPPTPSGAWNIASLLQGVARVRAEGMVDATSALRMMARQDPAPEFRARALDLMARFAPEEALAIAEHSPWADDPVFAASLARLRHACGKPVGAAAWGLARANADRPHDLAAAVDTLADRGDAVALAHLLPRARRLATPSQVLAAIHATSRFPDPGAADDLALILGESTDPIVAATALRALVGIVPAELEAICTAQLGRGGPREEAAIALLGAHGTVAVVPALLAFAGRGVAGRAADARDAVRKIQERAGGARGAVSVAEGGAVSVVAEGGEVAVVDAGPIGR